MRLALALVLTTARIALADPDTEATRAFQEGRDLAAHGRYAEACKRFARSYELDPGLGTALNLADCLEHQGQLRRAWELFDTVARSSQNTPSRERLARQRADALAGKLATVVVTLREPELAGLAIRLGDRALTAAPEIRELVEPRDIELVATAPGRPAYRTVLHAVAGATVAAEVALAPEPPRRMRSRVYLAGGLGGGALLALGGSLGFAISARSTYNRAFDHGCTRDPVICAPGDAGATGRTLIDTAGHRADIATGLVISGAALAAAAAAVYFTAPLETRVVPVGGGGLGVSFVGRF